MVRSILHEQLLESDRNSVLDGWRLNELRPRLEAFISNDVDRIMASVQHVEKKFVHGDFSKRAIFYYLHHNPPVNSPTTTAPNNILFDPTSRRITAIIDFDWARIGCIADECLLSFDGRYAQLPSPKEIDPDRIALRTALLHGFPSPLPPSSKTVEWDMAALWDAQLEEHGVIRACTIEGIEKMSWLYSFRDTMIPNTLSWDVIVKQRTAEDLEREKLATSQTLLEYITSPIV
ncbi:hypothetical protein O1611_g9517 [Lasiodiplodia mahajangana]|uniref:Uncharacterized protein n=1 Tax=Lasiodiplodia mahajangana TaxID=1108764 RepID=A0ACC2J8M6_9PEZI|nr:hypothetical protein O1611_g9517 [Lasiodiplodia mahajangana]